MPIVEDIPRADAPPPGGLIGALLAEQGDLTAVERFAQFHGAAEGPLQERYYQALLPARPPGPGEQLAFEVDLDRCSGCKACVAACHALNGLDAGETWRDVGLLLGGPPALPVLQHVTTACHHCLEPACQSACPVEAYEKDPATGIVRHLDDQCIGCQYCTLACPYDVPKYHAGKGIVRKCDMCADRLAEGEAPACVQACPHEAIRIRVVDAAEVRRDADAGAFLPGAFDPSYTRPTTRFRSAHRADLHPAAADTPRPEHAHTPLAVMLVLTQAAVGGFAVELAARLLGAPGGVAGPALPRLAMAIGAVGLAASVLHLGRPQHAYRAVLGLRHSWLSREVVALGVFAKAAAACVAAEALAGPWLDAHPAARPALLAVAVATGALGVACSVMVYHVVRRPYWHASIAGPRFAATALGLGLAAALACLGVGRAVGGVGADADRLMVPVALALVATTLAGLIHEARDARHRPDDSPRGRTARLLRGPLRIALRMRRLLGLAGGVALPLVALATARGGDPGPTAAAAAIGLVLALAGELAGRRLFFTAVSKPKMPGGLPS